MLEAQQWRAPEIQVHTEPKIKVEDLPAGSLDEVQAKALFARFGIPVVPERIVSNPAQAQAAARTLGGRVVLKVLSRNISHKTEVGGVATNVTAETAGERLLSMSDTVAVKTGKRPQRFVVQQMIEGGTELILGMHVIRWVPPFCWAWEASPRSCSRTRPCGSFRQMAGLTAVRPAPWHAS
jgi:acyl-CoA synthetase (NDP forming)